MKAYTGLSSALILWAVSGLSAAESLPLREALGPPPRAVVPANEEIRAKMQSLRSEFAEVLDRVGSGPRAPVRLPEMATLSIPDVPRVDLDALADHMAQAIKEPIPSGLRSDLIIFVSESMPPDVLKAYSRQANEFGGVLAVRGFKGGLTQAAKRLSRLQGEYGAPWMIHPEGFQQFKVTHVPTIVLADAAASSVLEDGCARESDYAAVVGDVSIEHALRLIQRKGAAGMATQAESRLRLFKEGRFGAGGDL